MDMWIYRFRFISKMIVLSHIRACRCGHNTGTVVLKSHFLVRTGGPVKHQSPHTIKDTAKITVKQQLQMYSVMIVPLA